ncbi:GNAT family N-acetyltransferase [Vibrio maritimus]
MAHSLSFQSFFNSLFVDMDGLFIKAEVIETDIAGKPRKCACFSLSNGALWLPLSYVSTNSRHRYTNEIYHVNDGSVSEVAFPDAVDLVLGSFEIENSPKRDRLFQRIGDSNDYIQRASTYKARHGSGAAPARFIESEQALVGGHSMHPSPKSCAPLSHGEQADFLPEFEAEFAIEWFAVAKHQLVGEAQVETFEHHLRTLFELSVPEERRATVADDYLPYPMHPLQAKAWRLSQEAQELADDVADLQLQSGGWQATSSSRAIYHPDMPWMLKVSLPIKLTNSLRLLTPKEAKRGTLFSQLLCHDAGQELVQRLPTTTFIEEPAWITICSKQGQELDLPLVSFRDNPFFTSRSEHEVGEHEVGVHDKTEGHHLLATANQICVGQSEAQVVSWVKQVAAAQTINVEEAACSWVGQFMQHVMAPLCIARSDYGLILLAHQQNIVLRIEDGLPLGMMYRDCQGSGITELALQRFASVFEHVDPEYFMPSEQVNPYLAYYLIGNSLMNTVSAIAAGGLATEEKLYEVCREHLARLAAAHPLDSSFYDYLLNSPTLRWKRNFLCFLEENNEATLSDPAEIYRDIANPLVGRNLPLCTKPLPDDTCISVYSTKHNEWSLVSNSIERGRVSADLCDDLVTATIAAKESLVWWSAIEHVFYHFDVAQVQCPDAPSFMSHVLEEKCLLSRSAFLQHAPIWHRPDSNPDVQLEQRTEHGIQYPTRPAKPEDVFYQRYLYREKRVVSFRKAQLPRDLNGFHRWHNDPAIAPVWELNGSKASHQQYLSKMESDPHQFPVIGEFDGIPFGYFEIYWTAEDRLGPFYDVDEFDRGAHMLSANARFRGWRYFSAWSRSIVHYCFLADLNTQNVMGEPRADNNKVLALTERIGFEHLFDFDFPHKRAAMLQCRRQRFFDAYAI